MFNIVSRRYIFFLISALVLVPGTFFFLTGGLLPSIDFQGGALYDVAFADGSKVTESGLRDVYAKEGYEEINVVTATDNVTSTAHFQIRSKDVPPAKKEALATAMKARFGPFTELRFESVGPSVSSLVTRNAAIAVIMASIGILLYLTLVFRTVPHPVRYGVCAIIAMLHDVGVVLGVAAIMGRFFHWEVDSLFLTALLTVIGFSVHDTIVVFDRIRENSGRMRGQAYEHIVNHSIVQTLDRSLNTQLTAIFTLVAIISYSEGQLQRFAFWLLIGILSGTYSSIFNAAPLLVVWENREWNRWFKRGGAAAPAQV